MYACVRLRFLNVCVCVLEYVRVCVRARCSWVGALAFFECVCVRMHVRWCACVPLRFLNVCVRALAFFECVRAYACSVVCVCAWVRACMRARFHVTEDRRKTPANLPLCRLHRPETNFSGDCETERVETAKITGKHLAHSTLTPKFYETVSDLLSMPTLPT